MSIINPYKAIKFNSFVVEQSSKLKTYFVFTGFQNLNTTQGLFESLSSLDNKFTYTMFLEKEEFGQSILKIDSKINSLLAKVANQDTSDTDLLGKLAEQVKRLVNKLNPIGNELIEEELEHITQLKQTVKENKEGLTNFGLVFSVSVDSTKEAKEIIDQVENIASSHKINLPAGYFIQDQLHNSNNLRKKINNEFKFSFENRLTQLFTPLVYQTNQITDHSIFLGSTKYGNTPFFINYEINVVEPNHFLLLGGTGNGKSAISKSLIWQFAHLGYRVLILDPQNEYKTLVKELDGADVDLSESKGINIFDLDKYSSMQDLTSIVKMLFSSIIGAEISDREVKLINNALHSAKANKNKDKFTTFLKQIEKVSELKVYLPALKNERVVKLLTDNQTVQAINNNVLRFSFSDLSNGELTLFVSITSQVIARIMSDKDTPTVLLIDEAFKFFNSNSGKQIESWLRQMRKLNTAVGLIDQSVRSYGDIAETIWENTTHHFLFAHNPTNAIKIDKELYNQVVSLPKYNFLYHKGGEFQQYNFIQSIIPDNIKNYV